MLLGGELFKTVLADGEESFKYKRNELRDTYVRNIMEADAGATTLMLAHGNQNASWRMMMADYRYMKAHWMPMTKTAVDPKPFNKAVFSKVKEHFNGKYDTMFSVKDRFPELARKRYVFSGNLLKIQMPYMRRL